MRDPPLEDVVSAEEKGSAPPLKAAILQLMGLDAPPRLRAPLHRLEAALLFARARRRRAEERGARRRVHRIPRAGPRAAADVRDVGSADHRELLRRMPNGILGKDAAALALCTSVWGCGTCRAGRETGWTSPASGLRWSGIFYRVDRGGRRARRRLYVRPRDVPVAGVQHLVRQADTATFPGGHPIPEGSKVIVTNAPWYVERVWSALKYSGAIPARTLAKVRSSATRPNSSPSSRSTSTSTRCPRSSAARRPRRGPLPRRRRAKRRRHPTRPRSAAAPASAS